MHNWITKSLPRTANESDVAWVVETIPEYVLPERRFEVRDSNVELKTNSENWLTKRFAIYKENLWVLMRKEVLS